MSSPPSDRMEEDAWLMKIETKREEPTDAVKGDKGKEATVDPSPVAEQALLPRRRKKISLSPTLLTLLLRRLRLFASLK